MSTARTIALVSLLSVSTAVSAHAQDQRTVAGAGDRPWSTVVRLNGAHDGQASFRLSLEAKGVIPTKDGSAVADLRPGGSLQVVHELLPGYVHVDPLHAPGTSLVRMLSVQRGDGGELHYDYKVNGVRQPFEAEAEAWLAGLLRQHHRR